MVLAHGIADDTGAFPVRFIRTIIQFDHRKEDSPLDRF